MNVAQNMYYQIERIVPLVDKYAPTRSAELRNGRKVSNTPSILPRRCIRRCAGSAKKAPSMTCWRWRRSTHLNSKICFIRNAAWKAVTSGDTARAKEIADKIPDPVQRRQVADQIDNQAARAAEGDNKVVEARRLSEKATRSIARSIS